ncbi:MAG TPA: NAD(P)-dependent oxidoreductase [Gemmatimonadales bacterium]|jgi:nucleoside-diphosphate-sugar epimerase
MRILICGATGVIGRYAAPLLVQAGHDVTALVRSEPRADMARAWDARPISGDILVPQSLHAACAGQDVVINLATSLPRTFPGKPGDFAMNDRIRREGTANLLLACEKAGVKRLVQESMIWVHGDQWGAWIDEDAPLKPGILARSAVDMESQVNHHAARTGMTTALLRCGGLYAAEAWHIREIIDRLRRRLVPVIGHGDNFQCFIHAADAAAAFARAAAGNGTGAYFVTDDEPLRLGDYLRWLAKAVRAPEPIRIPQFVARMTLGSEMAEAYGASLRCRNNRLRDAFGWVPRYPTTARGYAEVLPRLMGGEGQGRTARDGDGN